MRVMVIVKATKSSEAGEMPSEKLLTEMGGDTPAAEFLRALRKRLSYWCNIPRSRRRECCTCWRNCARRRPTIPT